MTPATVNGAVVAVSHRDDWGTRTCSMRKEGCLVDVAGCNDTCRRTFAVDELKVWNYAKTAYPAQRRGPNTTP